VNYIGEFITGADDFNNKTYMINLKKQNSSGKAD
jgi:hypothetical protein